MISGSNLEIVD